MQATNDAVESASQKLCAEYMIRFHALPDQQGCAIKLHEHAAPVKAGSLSPVRYACVETEQPCSASSMVLI